MIYRSKPVTDYTRIRNEIFRSGLSLEAIGLLTYILSNDKKTHETREGQLETALEMLIGETEKAISEIGDNFFEQTRTTKIALVIAKQTLNKKYPK